MTRRWNGGFGRATKEATDQEKFANLANFSVNYPRQKKMMDEIKERIPWKKAVIDSMFHHVSNKGKLTMAQEQYLMSMYIDSIAISDDKIAEQVAARKMCHRLMKIDMGRSTFINDIYYKCASNQFTTNMVAAIHKMAHKYRVQLSNIPEVADDEWEGWWHIPKENPTATPVLDGEVKERYCLHCRKKLVSVVAGDSVSYYCSNPSCDYALEMQTFPDERQN